MTLIPKLSEELKEKVLSLYRKKYCHATSPQAKGRVERLFGVLQDRLIKEMRLEGISTKEEASESLRAYLPAQIQQAFQSGSGKGFEPACQVAEAV